MPWLPRHRRWALPSPPTAPLHRAVAARTAVTCNELARVAGDGGRLYHVSRNLLLAHEDKTYEAP